MKDFFGLDDVSRPLARYILKIGFAGAAILLGALIWFFTEESSDKWVMSGIVIALYASSNLMPHLYLKRGADRIAYRFSEFPTLIAAAMGEPAAVIIVASLFTCWDLRRDWNRFPTKRSRIPYNFGSWVICTTVVAVTAANLPTTYGFIIAVLLGTGVTDLMLGRVIGLFSGQPMFAWIREGFALRHGLTLLSGVAVTVLFALPLPNLALYGIAPVVIMLLAWVSIRAAFLIGEGEHWRRVDALGKELVNEMDETAIIQTAAQAALEMFKAHGAKVVLVGFDGNATICHWKAQEIEPEMKVVPADTLTPLERGEVENHEGIQVTVALRRGNEPMGSLTVDCPRYAGGGERRTRFVSAFAHTVSNHLHIARSTREIQQQAADHAYLANHDALTGLGNRRMLTTRGPVLLARAEQRNLSCVMIVVDLDGFKNVNDTLGHEAGDQMLVEVSERLKSVMRTRESDAEGGDLIVRLGGDEFAILTVNHSNPKANAAVIAQRLQRSLAQPVTVQGMMVNVDCCIGIAMQHVDGHDIADLMRKGDIAMYDAKKVGSGQWRFFDAKSVRSTAADLTLASEMCAALANREIICHFQPQVSMTTGRVIGFEALVRWEHPERGLLFPDTFLPVVESTEQIHDLANEVLHRAAEAHGRLSKITGQPLTMSVNMSVRNLLDVSLPARVKRIVEEHGMDIRDLVIEITETAPIGDMPMVRDVVAALAETGCTISLDDFGTGYSSLSAISEHSSVREIKIDRDFTMKLSESATARVTVESIVKIAASKGGCRVVGEGVEDAETAALLVDLGCDVVQGYYFSKPLSESATVAWLTERYDPKVKHVALGLVAVA